MLKVDLDKTISVAILTPEGALSETDFELAAAVIDSYIEKNGKLKGIIVNTKTFPGWKTFGSLIEHFNFIREHHKKVSHVALVTDSVVADLGETIASHFLSAEIKHFAFDELEKARGWVMGSN